MHPANEKRRYIVRIHKMIPAPISTYPTDTFRSDVQGTISVVAEISVVNDQCLVFPFQCRVRASADAGSGDIRSTAVRDVAAKGWVAGTRRNRA